MFKKDRETRIEDRRKIERGPIYAFGSSTPRMFSSIDLGNISPSILWRRYVQFYIFLFFFENLTRTLVK